MVVSRQIVAAFVIADVGINLAISSTYLLCKQTSGQSSEQHKPRGHTCASAAAASPAAATAAATVAQGSGKGNLIRDLVWEMAVRTNGGGKASGEGGGGNIYGHLPRAYFADCLFILCQNNGPRLFAAPDTSKQQS